MIHEYLKLEVPSGTVAYGNNLDVVRYIEGKEYKMN